MHLTSAVTFPATSVLPYCLAQMTGKRLERAEQLDHSVPTRPAYSAVCAVFILSSTAQTRMSSRLCCLGQWWRQPFAEKHAWQLPQ